MKVRVKAILIIMLMVVVQFYLMAFDVWSFSYNDENGTRYAINTAIFFELVVAFGLLVSTAANKSKGKE